MKNKNLNRILSLCFALSLCFCLGISAFAAEIGVSGGSGVTPVSLTTTNGGIGDNGEGGGVITPTKLSVVVPTTLPMAMSDDGTVVTATDCRIINNSYGAVRVKSVSITAANGWKLTSFGDKSALANEKVDSNKLGFAIRIGGGTQMKTSGNNATQYLISSPVAGCYMTGVGNPSGNSVKIDYAAIVTPLSNAVKNATVANVVFVIEWDTAA